NPTESARQRPNQRSSEIASKPRAASQSASGFLASQSFLWLAIVLQVGNKRSVTQRSLFMPKRKSTSRAKQEEQVRNRALHVLARMRRTGISLTAAARDESIDPRTVRRYVGADL